MAEEIVNEDDLVEEEDEDVRESDDRQNLDDLTVLNEEADELDDPEGLQQDDDQSDWEEPVASNSLSVIHTGSAPTDAELLANLAPEGEAIVRDGEIVPGDETAGQPLPEVDAPDSEIPNPQPAETAAAPDNDPPPPPASADDAPPPVEPQQQEEAVREPVADPEPEIAQTAPASAAPVPPTVTEPRIVIDPPDDDPVAVDPDVEATDASGSEDTAIPLDIEPAGATEIVISDVPTGATLSAGRDNGDGTWSLTDTELEGLTITPPADSDADFTLSVTADGVTVPLEVTVDAVADAPTADAESVSGQESTAIDLDLSAALTDIDGSESLSVTISGVPEGATLSAGVNNGDGTWTVESGALGTLSLTPVAGFAGDIALTLSSTSTEADGGDSATTEVPFTVTVRESVDAENATTLEDTAVALSIDPGDSTEIVIGNVPTGAVLSAGIDNGDGTWTLTADQVAGVTITPPANSDVDFTLSVTADGVSEDLVVTVDAVADAPTATAENVSGVEDTAIELNLGAVLTDTDLSETLSVSITGVPDGAVLSAGVDNGDGTWTVDASNLAGLTLTPPTDFYGEIPLGIRATSTEADGGDTATTEASFTVTVASDGDFGISDAEGLEDSAIPLDIDISEAIAAGLETDITISNVPTGATLSAGIDNGDGTWTVPVAGVDGLTITPPADSDVDFTLSVTVGDFSLDLDVVVNADADAPTVEATDVTGLEDTAIALDLGTALTDIDGSESLSVTISGMPEGATLSAGVNNNDGTWTIDAGDLATLTLTPPADFAGDIPLTLSSTSTEADGGDAETTEIPFTVSVSGVVDAEDAETLEDTAVAITIDPGEGTEVVISDVPDGAVLSAGVNNNDGSWTVQATDLDGLTITPPANSDADFTLTVTADGHTDTMDVAVAAVADTPTAAGSDEFGALGSPVPLDLSAGLTDIDGSETLSIQLSGIPAGSVITVDGQEVPVTDGAVTLTADQLADVSIIPVEGFIGNFDLTLTSTATDTDQDTGLTDVASQNATFTIQIDDMGDFTVTNAAGIEDKAISLTIDAGNAPSVEISGLPAGAELSAGTLVSTDPDTGAQTWTVDAADLDGLTVTPPANSDMDFTLQVKAGDVTQNMDVRVDAVADAPELNLTSSIGDEDTSIPLSISQALPDGIATSLTDGDGSETLSISVQGMPDGSTLTYVDGAGQTQSIEIVHNDDSGVNSAALTPEQLNGLAITPPADYYGDMTLQVTSTATEVNPTQAGDEGAIASELGIVAQPTATNVASFGVTVRPMADNPELTMDNVSGSEETAISLNIEANMGGSTVDLQSVQIFGIEPGSTLNYVDSAGETQVITFSGTSAELTPEQLNGLTLTPPEDFNGDFTLTVSANSADGGVAVQQMNVDVAAISDLNIVDTQATGDEDTAIALNITAAADETVTIADVPEGAILSAGLDNGDGSWTLTAAELNGLTITPPENSDVDFDLSVYAGAVDGTPDGTISVSVDAVADVPSLDLTAAAGAEDTAIALDIDTGLGDTDGSETLSIAISDIPVGSVLNYVDEAGAIQSISIDGTSATLNAQQLNGLTITPPLDFNAPFNLSVSATATEADGGSFEVTSGTMTVDVTGVADQAEVLAADAAGLEDGTIPLNIGASGNDDISSITIAGVPAGAELSAGTDNGDGSWTLAPDDLAGLTIRPAENSDADFTLSVSATTVDGEDSITSAPVSLDVSVAADADMPTLDLSLSTGLEDTAIALEIDAGLTDTDGSESLSITIADIPAGATLNYVDTNGITQGVTVTNGSASLNAEQLNGLTITPADNFDGSFDLTVSATSTEADGGDFEVTSGTLTVDVAAVADDAVIGAQEAFGTEDQPIALAINATSDDDITSVVISGVPDGALLSAGTDNGDGTWTLSEGDLAGLTVTPPADSNVDFQLSVAVTTEDGTASTTTTGTLDVNVTGDADAPSLNLFTASGDEDAAIPLQINTGLTDTDGSETLSITISDVPAGATLNHGELVSTDPETGAQTWSLAHNDLSGLTITPAPDSSVGFDLNVSVTATEDDGDTATTSGTLSVGIDGIADIPTLDLSVPASGTEDTAISLSINAGLSDNSESLSVTLGNIPDGASLTYVDAGGVTQSIDVTNGTAQLSPLELNGLAITPPANSSDDFQLSVLATSSDGDDQASKGGVLNVSVAGDADVPTLDLSAASGGEDTAIPLTIDSALTDTDGSEILSITISDVPFGATLNHGALVSTDPETGAQTWSLTAGDLDGLTLTPPTDFDGTINLGVTSTSTEADGDTASTSTQILSVTVTDDNVGPVATADSFAGSEDGQISFTAEQLLANDTDGNNDNLSITGFDQPANGTLVSDGDGNFIFTPDADWSGETSFTYTISDGQGGTSQASVNLDVDGIADTPTLSDATAGGNEDMAIALTLDPALTDTDGSETLSITIGDIPAGATLNYVDGEGVTTAITISNGSASLEPEQLNGLTITPPENANGTINLSVTATATEADGGAASTTSTLTVDVAAVNDGPVAVDDALSGSEDQAFTFTAEQLLANDTDVDGDTLTVQSVEQPDFGTIEDNGDGTYTFTPDENWSGQTDFTYTATDGQGGTSQGTVTVDIGDVNEGPVAADDTLSAAEDQPLTFSA
ncbi:MAG: tandem-95 repeat protein, partial [Rhodospirillales bacterium]|nr:tandem-95 repeat protein [Rhodospirillales bacterium]